jgi:hypothetical protein
MNASPVIPEPCELNAHTKSTEKGSKMIHNLKILGLGLVAMLAMSAVAASGASASFSSTDEHTLLTSSAITEQEFRVTENKRGFICKKAGLNTNTSTILEADKTAEQVTAAPEYSECRGVSPEVPVVHVEPTNCHFLFTDETNATEHAPVHVVCQNETEEIHVKATELKLICATIPGTNTANVGKGPATHNQNLTGVHYTNNGNHIDVDATVTGITSTTQGGCKEAGQEDIHHNGIYNGEVTVSGHNTAGTLQDLNYK